MTDTRRSTPEAILQLTRTSPRIACIALNTIMTERMAAFQSRCLLHDGIAKRAEEGGAYVVDRGGHFGCHFGRGGCHGDRREVCRDEGEGWRLDTAAVVVDELIRVM